MMALSLSFSYFIYLIILNEKTTCASVHFPEKHLFSQNSFQDEIITHKKYKIHT